MRVTATLRQPVLQVTVCLKTPLYTSLITNFNFWKKSKISLKKGSKLVRWWIAKEKKIWTYLVILNMAPGIFWDWVQKKKKKEKKTSNFRAFFRAFFIILLQNISFSIIFINVLTIFLAIYQTQSKHKTLRPLFLDGAQLSQGYRATTTRHSFYLLFIYLFFI